MVQTIAPTNINVDKFTNKLLKRSFEVNNDRETRENYSERPKTWLVLISDSSKWKVPYVRNLDARPALVIYIKTKKIVYDISNLD